MTKRLCPACGLELPEDAHASMIFHQNHSCQRARKNKVFRDYEVREVKKHPPRPCAICGEIFEIRVGTKLRPPRKTCYKTTCENELRRRVASETVRKRREKFILAHCLGLDCNAVFKSPVDRNGKALFHFCPKCRESRRDDDEFRFSEAYGATI